MEELWLADHYLIAEPELEDPNFKQSVVILLLHDKRGAFGLVLNKVMNLQLKDIIADIPEGPSSNLKIHWGGPVEKNALFFMQEKESKVGYEWSPMMVDHIKYLQHEWPLIPAPLRPSVKIFMGYSGWAAGQLENEILHRGWKSLPSNIQSFFYTKPSDLWGQLIERFGGLYAIAAKTGFKPCLN